MTSKTTPKIRSYFMALFGRRRTPIRVPKAKWVSARAQAQEWWAVSAPSAELARKLCLAWPTRAVDGDARITDHGRNRT